MTNTLLLRCLVGGVLVVIGRSCSSGMSDDYEYIENPVFSMHLSPPVGWTFFPPKSSDNYPIWYFVGQSNNTLQAKQRANAEIYASVLEAMTSANMQMYGVDVTNDFTPVQIENPTTNVKGVGPLYGDEEAGAITQTAIGGTAITTFVFQPYTVAMTVTLHNVGNTRYKWNIVTNTFMQKLSLNFNARFNGVVTITKF